MFSDLETGALDVEGSWEVVALKRYVAHVVVRTDQASCLRSRKQVFNASRVIVETREQVANKLVRSRARWDRAKQCLSVVQGRAHPCQVRAGTRPRVSESRG